MKNFLQDPELQKQLQQRIEAARRSIEKLGDRESHARGDSYFFHEANHLPVRWVAVVQHVDTPSLWYLVAADEYPDIGTCDIELPPNHAWAPLALRCGIGFWADAIELTPNNYAGRLVGEALDDARHRLSEMVYGTVPMPESRLAVDEDIAYCEWMEEISRVAQAIELRLQTDPIVVSIPLDTKSWVREVLTRNRDFGNHWVSQLGTLAGQMTGSNVEPSLAAAVAGHVGPSSEIPDGRTLDSTLKGALVLLKDSEGYELVFYPDEAQSESLPSVMIADSNSLSDHGKWVCGADHAYHWTRTLQKSAGMERIQFVIGKEKYSVEAF
jgi:hypothetical protein